MDRRNMEVKKVVSCILWENEEMKDREIPFIYTPEWVYRLRNMVSRNIQGDFRFVCLTDIPEKFNDSVETIPLKFDFVRTWRKLEIFRDDIFSDDSMVLYLDLDTLVLKSLEPFFKLKHNFYVVGRKHRNNLYKVLPNGRKVVKRYNASVMYFKPNIYTNYILGDFNHAVISEELAGDQDWISLRFPNLATFPNNWVQPNFSEKVHKDTKILSVKGKNYPYKNIDGAKKHKWIEEIWK